MEIEKRIKALRKFDTVVLNSAKRAKKLITQNWDKGKGADGNKMPKLTAKYREYKSKKGRKPIRDLLFMSTMRASLMAIRKKVNYYVLTFIGGGETDKALGNVKHAPNMMLPISDKINQRVQRFAFDLYNKIKG